MYGLSDHSVCIWTCLAACSHSVCVLEKHFTVSKEWIDPDINVSIDSHEFKMLKEGCEAIWNAEKGKEKIIFPEEEPTIKFAYSSVVSSTEIQAGKLLTESKVWVKRPGTGNILAKDFVFGKRTNINIP